VALADALETLATLWPELGRRLTPSDERLIRRELAAAVHGAQWDPNAVLRAALRIEPETHPAWIALAKAAARRVGAPPLPPLVAAAHLRLALEYSSVEDVATPDEVELAAEQRLWVVPMEPARPGLPRSDVLILTRDDERLAPRFQFDANGEALLPAVVAVNRILEVDDDPWGSASWWLTPHAALHAIPADEIRVGSQDAVLAAAAALYASA
jgi:hypothetical protein